jgi:uncharacterized protein (TIGR04255 family)
VQRPGPSANPAPALSRVEAWPQWRRTGLYDRCIEASATPTPVVVDFDRPPVVEVALAVQFAPVIDSLDAAAYATQIKEEFPRRAEQPPRPSMEERFEEPDGLPFRFQILEEPPTPLFWFLTEDESQLIQVQQDRFALNWRKVASSPEYPRYPILRERFTEYLAELTDLLAAQGKEPLKPDWCEVTYINQIDPEDGQRLPLREVLSVVQEPTFSFLPEAEDAQAATRFRIVEHDNPIGRLIVNANAAVRAADRAPVWILTLTARLRVATESGEGILRRLDLGREWVVRGFVDLTTERMHTTWAMHKGVKE